LIVNVLEPVFWTEILHCANGGDDGSVNVCPVAGLLSAKLRIFPQSAAVAV
jgi:hypothetical protein